MTYRGRVKNGVVVLEGAVSLSEGTMVRVEPIEDLESGADGSVYEHLGRMAGRVKGLPHDLARQHDHYLHDGLNRIRPWDTYRNRLLSNS